MGLDLPFYTFDIAARILIIYVHCATSAPEVERIFVNQNSIHPLYYEPSFTRFSENLRPVRLFQPPYIRFNRIQLYINILDDRLFLLGPLTSHQDNPAH